MNVNELRALNVKELQEYAKKIGATEIAGFKKQDLIKVILLLVDGNVFIFRFLPEHTSVYPSPYKMKNKKNESCARVP